MASPKQDKSHVSAKRSTDRKPVDPANRILQEIKIGKLVFSFFPQGTIMVKLGDNCDEWTLVPVTDASKLIDFLQKYVDSYKK